MTEFMMVHKRFSWSMKSKVGYWWLMMFEDGGYPRVSNTSVGGCTNILAI